MKAAEAVAEATERLCGLVLQHVAYFEEILGARRTQLTGEHPHQDALGHAVLAYTEQLAGWRDHVRALLDKDYTALARAGDGATGGAGAAGGPGYPAHVARLVAMAARFDDVGERALDRILDQPQSPDVFDQAREDLGDHFDDSLRNLSLTFQHALEVVQGEEDVTESHRARVAGLHQLVRDLEEKREWELRAHEDALARHARSLGEAFALLKEAKIQCCG